MCYSSEQCFWCHFIQRRKTASVQNPQFSLWHPPRGRGEEREGLAWTEIPANPKEAPLFPPGVFSSPADCRWGWALGKDGLRMKSCLDTFVLTLECLWLQHRHHEAPRWAGWRDKAPSLQMRWNFALCSVFTWGCWGAFNCIQINFRWVQWLCAEAYNKVRKVDLVLHKLKAFSPGT